MSVQTREQFADSEARVVTDMSADLLRLMSTIGLLIALAVIALGLMTATLNRLRDFAVLNALRARTRRLAEEKVDVREIAWLERVATHSRVDRDPRGRVLATAYLALVQSDAKPHLPPDIAVVRRRRAARNGP